MEQTPSYLSENIKTLRDRMGISQTEFGEIFQLKRTVIGAYETHLAEPSIEFVYRLAQLCKVSMEAIFAQNLANLAWGELPNPPFDQSKYNANLEHQKNNSLEIQGLKQQIALEETKNEGLQREVELLKQTVVDKQAIIDLMSGKPNKGKK